MDETALENESPFSEWTEVGHEGRLEDFTLPGNSKDILTQTQDNFRGKINRSKDLKSGITKACGTKKTRYEVRYDSCPYKIHKRHSRKYTSELDENASGLPTKKKEIFIAKTSKDCEGSILPLDICRPMFEESLKTEPVDYALAPLKRQASGTFTSVDSFSEIVSPSSAGTLRFYGRAESSYIESDMDTSDTGTPASTLNLPLSIYHSEKVNTDQYTTKRFRLFLQRYYEKFKDELDPEELADILLSKDVIKAREREQITEEKFRAERSDRLIKSLVRNSKKTDETHDERFVKVVIEAFSEARYGYLFDTFKELKEENIPEELPIDNLWMDKLSYFATIKGDELDALEVIDQLLAKEVITFDEHQNILDIPNKQDKIDTLVECIKRKSFRQFECFCEIIVKEFPDASKMLNEDIYERMEIPREIEHLPVIEIDVLKEWTRSQDSEAETAMKLTIEGDSSSGNELEQMIVDANSPTPKERLQELVVDDIHCGLQVSFSCIKITLECLSERSRMLLMQKCKGSPNFLKRWMKQLFNEEKMKMLLVNGNRKVGFKIQVNWPEIILTRHDIAQNYDYLKRKLEPKDYCNILTNVEGSEEILKLISSKEAREVRCRYFLIYMVANEYAPVEKLSEKLKGTDILQFIHQKRQNCSSLCTCKLTKRIIVEKFSLIEKTVGKIEEIVKLFAEFSGFDDVVKSQFQALESNNSFKTEEFLRNILALPDDGLQVCLFEYALIETNQKELLKTIVGEKTDKFWEKGDPSEAPKEDCFTITKDDVSRNISFLQQELEPMRFISMLSKQDDTAQLRDKILDANSRRQRCKVFLEYLKDSDVATMEMFTSELRRQHLTNILKCLFMSRQQGFAGYTITKDDIGQNMSFLEDILDPMELRHLLTDNENDKSRKALDLVLSASKKKRCKVFLDTMIAAEENVFRKFTTYLEKQMPNIIKFLVNARGQRDRKMKLVMESLLDTYGSIVEEIEPARLRNSFVERQVLTHTDFESILLHQSRRSRAVALMSQVLKGPVSKAQSMLDALEFAGYKSLVMQINKMQEKFKPCPRLYRHTLGDDECFTIEGTMRIMSDQSVTDETTHDLLLPSNTGLDMETLLSKDKIEHIYQWLEYTDRFLTEITQPENAQTNVQKLNYDGNHADSKGGQSTSKQFLKQKHCNKIDPPYHLRTKPQFFHCYDGFSSPGSSQFRRVDETGDKSSPSVGRSNSVSTMNEEDSNSTSPTLAEGLSDLSATEVLNLDRVRNDLTKISSEYRDSKTLDMPDTTSFKIHQVTATSNVKDSFKPQFVAVNKTTETVSQVCSCNLGGENVSQNDSKMGKCELHALYYIK